MPGPCQICGKWSAGALIKDPCLRKLRHVKCPNKLFEIRINRGSKNHMFQSDSRSRQVCQIVRSSSALVCQTASFWCQTIPRPGSLCVKRVSNCPFLKRISVSNGFFLVSNDSKTEAVCQTRVKLSAPQAD